MIKFIKPEKLNGEQLRDELNAVKIKISKKPDSVVDDGQNNLLLDINENDEIKAAEIVAAHIGIDTSINYAAAKTSAQAKLAALGLTEEEVASILG